MTWYLISKGSIGENWIEWIAYILVTCLNIFIILRMVFFDKRSSQQILLWLLTLILFPIIGQIAYFITGGGINIGKRRLVLKKIVSDSSYRETLLKQSRFINRLDTVKNIDVAKLIEYNINQNDGICTFLNDVKLYTNMAEHYDDMYADIMKAKENVNFEYFIIRPDKSGKRFRDALIAKAKQGVKIKVLYDDVGSLNLHLSFFKDLIAAGGEVVRFLPSIFKGISKNVNYRNHRKIVVIDNQIAYMGGANIGDEYLGEHKRIKPWRDTHLRLIGRSVDLLNVVFCQDFAFASKKEIDFPKEKELLTNKLMPIQIISDGPDDKHAGIEQAYIKAIYGAKQRIYLQTPYLAPSICFINALECAVKSGVEVVLMIPRVPDKPYSYHVTTYYASELVKMGCKVYMWDGFIHSKTMLVDDQISSVGTVNLDSRSFNLHFEVTAFIYNEEFCSEMSNVFKKDIENSIPFDIEYIKKFSLLTRFWQRIMRLLTPLM